MRIGWLIIGVLITVGLFIVYPNIFYMIVSWVQSAFHWVMGFVGSQGVTNTSSN
jgi:hypothetical protein